MLRITTFSQRAAIVISHPVQWRVFQQPEQRKVHAGFLLWVLKESQQAFVLLREQNSALTAELQDALIHHSHAVMPHFHHTAVRAPAAAGRHVLTCAAGAVICT